MGEKYLTKEGKFDYHKWVRLNSITEKVTVQPNASTMGSSLSHKLDGMAYEK